MALACPAAQATCCLLLLLLLAFPVVLTGSPGTTRCSPEEWTAWCRVRDGLELSNDFFEVVTIEPVGEPVEEEVFDLAGIARSEGWDESELLYFVFEFGTTKGVQYCREYYEMQNSARQPPLVVDEDLPVFDLVGVAAAEGWDQTELMFFVFEYGVEDGVSFCREYYEMKSRSQQEVRQVVCSEPTKEAMVQFLFRGTGGLGVQEVQGGWTLEAWFSGLEGRGPGACTDGYFTTLGGRVLDPTVEVRRLGLAGLQEIVFHGRLRGGAGKGAGRGDMPNVGEWQCSFCMAPHCWHTKLACYKCGTPRYWETGVMGQGNPGGFPGKGGGFVGGVPGQAAGFFGQGNVANAMGGARIVGPTGRDQAYVPRGEPTYRKGGGSKGGGKGDVDTGAGVGGKFFADGGGGSGGEAVGRGVGMGQAPAGPPPSHREQVVSALQALVGLFEPDVGAQVRGLVQGFLPPKPASPAPVTPTHAEIVAKLHKLYDSETQLVRKADEVEGRVEKVRAKLVEEEAALAKVQRELQGVKDQIMASLRDEQDCRERTRKGGSDSDGMEDAVTVDEGESSEEVVEKGKRRKVRRQGRFSRRGGAFGTSVNLLDVVGILKGLSKEDRGRCMRSAEMNDELSSMSGRNSGRGTAEDSTAVLTPCG